MKILALQLKRIGDVILTTPALTALRGWAPELHLTLAVEQGASSLLPALPQIDAAIVTGRGRGWTPWQQTLTGHFDAVVDFTGSDRSALLSFASRARRRVAFPHARKSWARSLAYTELVESPVRDRHTIDHYLDLTCSPAEPSPVLRVPSAAAEQARAVLQSGGIDGPFVLIHPGSARAEKYWVSERWAAVIAHCRDRSWPCVLTGGTDPSERAHLTDIERIAGPGLLNLAGRGDLLLLAALVAQARLVISVDTAAVHLAAALQRPQIALFGPTNPYHWRPRHPDAIVLSAASPEAPLTEFAPRLKGAPMDRLSTETVIRVTDDLLSRTHV